MTTRGSSHPPHPLQVRAQARVALGKGPQWGSAEGARGNHVGFPRAGKPGTYVCDARNGVPQLPGW
jgi:hypothetical protein